MMKSIDDNCFTKHYDFLICIDSDGSPSENSWFQEIKNYINYYDAVDSSIDAFVSKIMGESEFKGKSTVDVFCGLMDTRF